MDYLVAGIDPGSFGGISLLDETGVAIKALPTPCSQIVKGGKLRAQIDIAQAYAVLMEFKAIAESKGKRLHICLEKVEAMFTDGAKSAFAFGRNIGMWEGIVVASQCPYSFVTPPAWKREMISKTVSNAKMPQGKKSKKKLREHGEDSLMLAEPLRVGVVGVGYLGRFHALIYSRMADVDLIGVADTNLSRARDVASGQASSMSWRSSARSGESTSSLTQSPSGVGHAEVRPRRARAGPGQPARAARMAGAAASSRPHRTVTCGMASRPGPARAASGMRAAIAAQRAASGAGANAITAA
jgi:hypothetical protein